MSRRDKYFAEHRLIDHIRTYGEGPNHTDTVELSAKARRLWPLPQGLHKAPWAATAMSFRIASHRRKEQPAIQCHSEESDSRKCAALQKLTASEKVSES
jgi:hypothetical protein